MFINTTEKRNILKPLQIVIGIIEKKQTLPILSNVLIERKSSLVKFTTTDLEIQISTILDIYYVDNENSSATISAKKLQEILRILPDNSSISIELKENKAIITSNKSRFTLQTLPTQDYPKLNNQLDKSIGVSLSQKELKNLLLSVQYAMAQQDVRYYLNGVLIILDGNKMRAVATDGHRLAFNQIDIKGAYEKQEIILPRKAVIELCKLLNEADDHIHIQFTTQQLNAEFSGISLTTKLIDGKFPDFERVIPKYNNHLTVNRLLIQQALQRAAILSNEKFRGVRFVLTEKKLSIKSSNSEQEEAEEEIETDYHGEAIDIGFNVNYLIDGLNNMNGIFSTLSFGDPNSSILISSGDNLDYRYVVMPMRI